MEKDLALPASSMSIDGERVLTRWQASRVQSSNRAVGGHLFLTSHRLVFVPHGFDQALMGVAYRVPLADVHEATRRRRDLSQIMAGSLRDRLELVLASGVSELFVVNKLDAVIEKIEACLTAHRRG